MALSATIDWEIRTGATAGMLNGGGFDRAATFGITDGTVDANTGNTDSPILSSATYTFVASDDEAWVFIPTGHADCVSGFYQIASVTGGKATLRAAIGQAVQIGSKGIYNKANTVAGISTVGTPTGITIGVDYSQQNTADATATDYVSVGASTTLTSATAGFKLTHIGNIFHLTTTGTGGFGVVGWYTIATYTSTSQVTTDRTTNNGTALAAGTGYVGGAVDLTGLLCDSFFEAHIGGNNRWFRTGTYVLGSAVATVSASSTTTNPCMAFGYVSQRGDVCAGDDRPFITSAANSWTTEAYGQWHGLRFAGTTSSVFLVSTGGKAINIKAVNTSTNAGRAGINMGTDTLCESCEGISVNGNGISLGANAKSRACSAHDSATGISFGSSRGAASFCMSWANTTAAINFSSSGATGQASDCTLYGSEAKHGTGILIAATAANTYSVNNIIYGFTTGIAQTTLQQKANTGRTNAFFNNTANVSNFFLDDYDITTVDPDFAAVSQLSGSTATISGSTLTQTGAFGSVVDGKHYLHVLSGTGATVQIDPITSHTADTVTCTNAIGTNATPDKVWRIDTSTDFTIAGAL